MSPSTAQPQLTSWAIKATVPRDKNVSQSTRRARRKSKEFSAILACSAVINGHYVYVSPQKNLIILRFGESYGEFGDSQGWLELFYGFASNFD